MSDEQDKLKLSLEPPRLFGRKKKSAEAVEPAEAAESPAAPVAEESYADATPTPDVEDVPAPAEQPAETASEPVAEPAVEPEAADEELTTVLEDVRAAESGPAEPAVPAEPAEPEPTHPETEPTHPETETEAGRQQTAVLDPVLEPPLVSTPAAPVERPAAAPVVERDGLIEIEREDAEIAALAKDGPRLDVYPAAALTGLVVGAAMVVLTWLSLRGCEAVRGTSSCGGGPGLLLLIAIFALTVLLGSALLKAFEVPDPGSSSFLAVGLVAVVALLFLIDFVDSWAMIIVIPLLSVGAYLASVWVTKTFVEPGEPAT